MRQITPKSLTTTSQTYLDKLQGEVINGKTPTDDTSFEAQVARAENTWKPKNKAFDEIKETLTGMTVSNRCNYCECDRAVDMEHIYPKSKFPERAYTWTNYILACSACNSYIKGDKFAVFYPHGSNQKMELPRGVGKPPSDDGLLINPRLEDPQQYLRLNLVTRTFIFDPIESDEDARDYQRAAYTTCLLDINNPILQKSREAKASELVGYLRKYTEVCGTTDYEALKKVPNYPIEIDQTLPFEEEKERIKNEYKKRIIESPHLTVWDELKRQRACLPQVDSLFAEAGECLSW